MSKLLSNLTSRLSFAHLGVGARSGRASSDDDTTDGDKKSKKAKAGDDDEGDDPEKKPAAESGQELDGAEDPNAEGDDDDAQATSHASKDDSGKGGDEDDDDPDEEMKGKSAAAQARRREQARCAAIFAHSAAGKNPQLAANLAFKTRMSRGEALAILEGTPAPAPSRAAHPGRGAQNPNLSAAPAPQASKQQSVDASWEAARARNEAIYGPRK